MTDNDFFFANTPPKITEEMEAQFRRVKDRLEDDGFFANLHEPLEQLDTSKIVKQAKRSVLKAALFGALGTVFTISIVLGSATLAIGGALKLLGVF